MYVLDWQLSNSNALSLFESSNLQGCCSFEDEGVWGPTGTLRDVNVGCDQGLLSLREGRNQLHWAAVNSEAKRRGTERRYRSGGWIIQHTRARWRSHRSARVQLEVWCSSSESGWWMLADGRTGRSLSAARRSVHPSSLRMSRCQWREESPGQTPGGVLGWDPCGVEGYQAICTCWRVTSDGCASFLLHLRLYYFSGSYFSPEIIKNK